MRNPSDNEKQILLNYPPAPAFGEIIKLLLDDDGRIIRLVNDRNLMKYASIAEEICATGNIREHFNLPANKTLTEIISAEPGNEGRKFACFHNKKEFKRLEDPDRFYTSLPTTLLSLTLFETGVLLGAIRVLDIVPNISLESLSCIIYIDEKERLIGFNHNFFVQFAPKFNDPVGLLNKPLSLFLSPGPSEIQARQLARFPLPEGSALPKLYSNDFGTSRELSGSKCSRPDLLAFSPDGLHCANHSDDIIFITLPLLLDTRMDFLLTVEAETTEGVPPLFFLGKEFVVDRFVDAYPDTEGYQIGPNPDLGRFVLKRKSNLQITGAGVDSRGSSLFTFAKSGQTLRLLQDGREKLAYFDFHFLHFRRATVTLGIRIGSTCRIARLELKGSLKPVSAAAPEPPVVRLKTAEPQFSLLSRISNVSAANNHPGVSIYLLENITQLQTQLKSLEKENRRLQVEAGMAAEEFIGASPSIQAIKRNAAMVAGSDTSVLVQGETGTGKEVLARYIHRRSQRKDGPFVKVDCSTLSQTLMESELFGHEKGSFTGAVARKTGCFERADKGTLFLDEVGNLASDTQAKLLHFLQDHTVTRVGGDKPLQLDVRVIVASNAPLQELVAQKKFRSDLFYRMDVVSITLPPLRDRLDDLPEFCRHFLAAFNTQHGKKISDLTPEAYRKLYRHMWPGNVRELRNTLERAIIFCAENVIGEEAISFSMGPEGGKSSGRKPYQFVELETKTVRDLLRKHKGNVSQVILELGMPRRTFYGKLKKLGTKISQLRTG